MSSEPINPNRAVDYIRDNAGRFAAAKADRIYIEEFRKSKKALLMAESTASSAVAREQYAYSHPEYLALLDGLREAVRTEETVRWEMIAAQARIEIWRSQEASNRNQDRVMR